MPIGIFIDQTQTWGDPWRGQRHTTRNGSTQSKYSWAFLVYAFTILSPGHHWSRPACPLLSTPVQREYRRGFLSRVHFWQSSKSSIKRRIGMILVEDALNVGIKQILAIKLHIAGVASIVVFYPIFSFAIEWNGFHTCPVQKYHFLNLFKIDILRVLRRLAANW